ncbi:Receptor-like cytosolic serine/threonine-protein kinase RBK2 [Vitis vinifera]|uniref:Receptor-like cytosolic serine/threonine-protein kinase RBK2 n=1 Tax=Vitis vinifera TaxID=29760 RepID=A0A438KHS5_VITVI|nr:Receptor-like cytosolic serine/threonine-protein kinase RBK2 [Vitis vinifera]
MATIKAKSEIPRAEFSLRATSRQRPERAVLTNSAVNILACESILVRIIMGFCSGFNGVWKQASSSPNCVLEDYLSRLESETSSSKEGTSGSGSSQNTKPTWRGLIQLLRTQSKRRLATLDPRNVLKYSVRKCRSMRFSNGVGRNLDGETVSYSRSGWKNFTSLNFSVPPRISAMDGQLVAVKRLVRGKPEERTGNFLSELGIMAHVNHPNTAKLIGYGVEGGLHLVLELSPHGSLASLLHGNKVKLKWSMRYQLALGIAEGLLYLHEGCQRRFIHRDIKASNILLTEDFQPQLITGRRALECSQRSLVTWAKPLLKKNDIQELVDPFLADDQYNSRQMKTQIQELVDPFLADDHYNSQQMNLLVVEILKGNFSSLEGLKKRGGILPKGPLQRAVSCR